MREGLTHVVLLEETFGVVVAVDVNLGECVVDRGILLTGSDLSLEPREDELETVSLLDFIDKFVDGNWTSNASEESLDRVLVAVNIEETSNDLRSTSRVDLLNVNLDEVGETVLVKVQNEIVNEVESVANDDERKLIGEFGLLEEVLYLLGVVEV